MTRFGELEKTKGTLETLMVLLEKGETRTTHLIKSISASRETFYRIVKLLKKYKLAKKLYIEDRDVLIWTLTPKGEKIAKHLIEIEKILNL